MKKILLVNDDGFDALGIKIAEKALLPFGEVSVVAPNKEQSATSHSIILHRSFQIEEKGNKHYTIDGTPADCVRVGTSLFGPFDYVVSGVNNGLNLGTDVIYSGTVGAASEALILGYKAMAISVDFNQLDIAEAELDYVFRRLLNDHFMSDKYFLNVNFPIKKFNRSFGMKISFLGQKDFRTKFLREGNKVVEISTEITYDNRPLSDVKLAENGFISVSPVDNDQTNYREIKELMEKE